ncbi:mitochondrial peroxiredoxin PRX1 [Uncinocarpus reesii 1704]|uniref:Mitochondrial peroxiredoxin PRX1 n=1 Tax=Uncinocarpus reesii (strain UAMH 1704) TaxID=336963 RepID=C4JHU7_UNCRE|nr:mitochondrial peroxiredoxin PRX1 [Uncinocarpus reesii 1704]EEP77934.1 mitochondrial peroxiredoxin PRX1 [Uncinocarpus reesii 1704]
MADQSQRAAPLRLGSVAPNFKAVTTKGDIDFHEFIGNNWVILFSHPDDFTPTCTTELGAFAKLEPEFTKRGVKLIGLSANGLKSHHDWIKDIDEVTGSNLQFPIIADADRNVSYLYDMIDYQDTTNVDEKGMAMTIRSVFIIDPNKKIRLIMSYPATTGRNTAEVLRVVDALQTTDKNTVNTAINWTPGDDVIIPPFVSTEDAEKKFGQVRVVKPDLQGARSSLGHYSPNKESEKVFFSYCTPWQYDDREPLRSLQKDGRRSNDLSHHYCQCIKVTGWEIGLAGESDRNG